MVTFLKSHISFNKNRNFKSNLIYNRQGLKRFALVTHLQSHGWDYTAINLNVLHCEVTIRAARLPVNNFSLIYDSNLSPLPVKFQVRRLHTGMLEGNLNQISLTSYNNSDVRYQSVP